MEIKIICELCRTHGYPYKENGLCVYNVLSKESNPGDKLPECKEE